MVRQVSKYSWFISCVLLCTALVGCTSFRPYRLDLTQGNQISQEKVGQLAAGMTEEQVHFLLGTPILQDVFHADRWDYVYFHKPGYSQPTERRLSVYFDNGKVTRFTGDVIDKPTA